MLFIYISVMFDKKEGLQRGQLQLEIAKVDIWYAFLFFQTEGGPNIILGHGEASSLEDLPSAEEILMKADTEKYWYSHTKGVWFTADMQLNLTTGELLCGGDVYDLNLEIYPTYQQMISRAEALNYKP